MTDLEIHDALREVANQAAKSAIELHATAIRSAVSTQPRPKQPSTLAVIGIVIAMLTPIGGIAGWVNSLNSRMSVVETKLLSEDEKLNSIDKALEDLAALKQELTDFRGEFHDWKRENGYAARRGDGSSPK